MNNKRPRYVIVWTRNGLAGCHTYTSNHDLVNHCEQLFRDGYAVETIRRIDFVPNRD